MSTLYTWAVTEGIEHAFKTHDIDFLVTPGWSWISVYSAIAGGQDDRFLDVYKLINSLFFPGAPMGTVPLGIYPNGRPFGLTFVARKGQDAKLLQLMQLYEKAFPSRQIPSSMSSRLANLYFRLRGHIL